MKLGKAFKRNIKKVARTQGKITTTAGKVLTASGKASMSAAPLVTTIGVATGQPEIVAAGASMAGYGALATSGGRVTKNYGRVQKHASKGKSINKPAKRTVTGAFSLGSDAIQIGYN